MGSIFTRPFVTYDKWKTDKAKNKLQKLSESEAKVELDFSPLQIHQENKLQLYLNPNDEGLSVDLIKWRFREPVYTYLFNKFLQEEQKNIDSLIDIGSNIGYFPKIELMSGIRKIMAIEPIPDTFHFLEKNIGASKKTNLFNMAISDKKERLKLYSPIKRNLATAVQNIDNSESAVNIVEAVSLKEFIEQKELQGENIVIRMDVEGFEKTILKEIPKEVYGITFEMHPHFIGAQSTLDLLNKMRDEGFKIWAMLHSGVVSVYVLTYHIGLSKAIRVFEYMTHKPQIFMDKNLEDINFVNRLVMEGQSTHIIVKKP